MNEKILSYVRSLSPDQFKREVLNHTFAKNAIEYSKKKPDKWTLFKFLVR